MPEILDLTLALKNAPALRRIAEGSPVKTLTALGEAIGRDQSNLTKSIALMEQEGLLVRQSDAPVAGLALTAEALALLPRLDILEGLVEVPADFAAVLHSEIGPSPLNPRKTFDPDKLDELRIGIVTAGRLIHNLLLRPADEAAQANGVRFWIVAGERRWRAIGLAIADGDWPADKRLPAQVKAMSDAEHRAYAVAENIQRVDLDHVELGEFFKLQMLNDGATPQSIADAIGKSPEYVQQHLRILRLPDEVLGQVRAEEISFHKALEIEREGRITPKADQPNLLDPHSATLSEQVAALGTATLAGPAADGPSAFDLPPKLALVVAELTDKAERFPAAGALGVEGYTQVNPAEGWGDAQPLVVKGIIAQRRDPEGVYFKVNLHSTGAKAWLEAQGFYGTTEQRGALIQDLRTRAYGSLANARAHASGRYATPFLNMEAVKSDPKGEAQPQPASVGRPLPESKPTAPQSPPAPEAQSGALLSEPEHALTGPAAFADLVKRTMAGEGEQPEPDEAPPLALPVMAVRIAIRLDDGRVLHFAAADEETAEIGLDWLVAGSDTGSGEARDLFGKLLLRAPQ